MSNQPSSSTARPAAVQPIENGHAVRSHHLHLRAPKLGAIHASTADDRNSSPLSAASPCTSWTVLRMADWNVDALRSAPVKFLRAEHAHAVVPEPLGSLSWTRYAMASDRPAVTAAMDCGRVSQTIIVSSTSRKPSPRHAAARATTVRPAASSSDVSAASLQQRFYPAQWRSAAQPSIESLLTAHGCELQWVGWDKSLPLVFAPAEQFTRAILGVLRLVLRISAARGRTTHMQLSVRRQQNLAQAMVFECGAAPALPASTTGERPNEALRIGRTGNVRFDAACSQELLRTRRLAQSFGGELTVSSGRYNSTVFHLSAPVDDRLTLVRRWLTANAIAGAANAQTGCDAPQDDALTVRMFIVGCQVASSETALRCAEARLSSLARQSDFVYRAAPGRWVWLTDQCSLPPEVCNGSWHFHAVNQWKYPANLSGHGEAVTSEQLFAARKIVAHMDAILGMRVPPCDDVQLEPARPRRPRIDRASPLRSAHTVPAARQNSVGTTSAKPPAPALAKQLRWRYPI